MYTLEHQKQVTNVIRKHKPRFKRLYRGLLYGSGAAVPTFVEVPVRLGLLDTPHPDGLDTTWWIPAGNLPSASSVDLERTRITITHWPLNAASPLPSAYTICVAPQPQNSDNETPDTHAINDQVQLIVPGLMNPIRGSVLVVKHSDTQLEHMEEADEDLARSIVQGFDDILRLGYTLTKALQGFWRRARRT
ncbi:hypothetical protein B0H11DRAFT_2260128 [Mycena galericulata]|nr:hypothetical protein B0H11DRAFT_2260128 [Mycena galericulata]